jgi:hypothetical protein
VNLTGWLRCKLLQSSNRENEQLSTGSRIGIGDREAENCPNHNQDRSLAKPRTALLRGVC